MSDPHVTHPTGQAGDWVQVRDIHGGLSRRGEILEVLGGPGHRHYRVRWDEQHESIFFPADGTVIVPRHEHMGQPHDGGRP